MTSPNKTTVHPGIVLNVLIACEESQAECMAFRALGHNAFSCDIEPCRRGTPPEYHIQGDVTPLLLGERDFITQDGTAHTISHWHLIIAHPPCTYLCKVSSVQLVSHGIINEHRLLLMQRAVDFFNLCLKTTAAHYVAVENPIPMARAGLPRPSCFIQPSWFGVKYTKKTLYWLRNLPPIFPEIIFPNPKSYVHCSRGKYRSRTFTEVAAALARQWSAYIIEDIKK